MFQMWSSKHVLVVNPNRSKPLSQENVATASTPYSPLVRAAGTYKMLSPLSGVVNGGQVAMHGVKSIVKQYNNYNSI